MFYAQSASAVISGRWEEEEEEDDDGDDGEKKKNNNKQTQKEEEKRKKRKEENKNEESEWDENFGVIQTYFAVSTAGVLTCIVKGWV